MTVEHISAAVFASAADGSVSATRTPFSLGSTMHEVADATAKGGHVVFTVPTGRVKVTFAEGKHLEVKLLFGSEALTFPAELVTEERLRHFLLRWHAEACSLVFRPNRTP